MARKSIKKFSNVENEIEAENKFYNIRKKIKFKNEAQKQAYDEIKNHRISFLCGPAGTAKSFLCVASALDSFYKEEVMKIVLTRPMVEAAGEKMGFLPGPQPLDAKVLTPNGWVRMGDLSVGDFVIARDGNPSKVLKIYPKGKKRVYKITTNDGSSTECCEDHLWLTQNSEERKRKKSGKIRTTKEIMETLNHKKSKTDYNHSLPRNECINFNSIKLPLPAYTLGVLLGDGHLGNSISLASKDEEIINRVKEDLLDFNVDLVRQGNSILYNLRGNVINNKPARQIKVTNIETREEQIFDTIGTAICTLEMKKNEISSSCNRGKIRNNKKFEFLEKNNKWQNKIKQILDVIGLLGTHSYDKFIPNDYIYKASIEDRISLLQGLMDTDGNCNMRNGYCEANFTTVSKKLANDLRDLVRSLGGRSSIRERDRSKRKTSEIKGRKIIGKHKIYEVSVNTPNGINPFFLTRKSKKYNKKYMQFQKIKSVDFVKEKETQCILIDSDEHLYITDDFIVTHNTLEEKIHPYLIPLFDLLGHFISEEEIKELMMKKRIEICPLAFMRGRTLEDCFVVADEMQNAKFDQIKMLTSRIGSGTKMVLTGDSKQSDLKSKCCFDDVSSKLSSLDFVGYFKFDREHIVRDPIIAQLLDKLDEIKNGWED